MQKQTPSNVSREKVHWRLANVHDLFFIVNDFFYVDKYQNNQIFYF